MTIRKLRLQRGWSQEHLAYLSGLNIKTIQRVEQGKTAGLETLNSLAAVFEVELKQLQADSETKSDEKKQEENIEAKEYVDDVRDFYAHLIAYATVMLFITVAHLSTSPGEFKGILICAAIWGVGIALHALGAFGYFPWFTKTWETKKIENRLGRKR